MGTINAMADACAELLSGNSVLAKPNREIARLQVVIGLAERSIQFIHANFPISAPTGKPTPEKKVESVAREERNEAEPESDDDERQPSGHRNVQRSSPAVAS